MDIKDRKQFQQMLDRLEEKLYTAEAQEAVPFTDATDQENAAWLQNFLDLSQKMVLVRPPASVRSSLRHHFDQLHRQTQPSPSLWQRLTARLTFDSNQQLAVAGMRSAVLEDRVQQLVYATPTAEIALHLHPHDQQDGRFNLYGQVFPLADTTDTIYAVQLCQADIETATTATDELGEFSFQAIGKGIYDIVFSSDQFEVVITPITL